MYQNLKLLLISLLLCVITYGLMHFLHHYVLLHLPEWSFNSFGRFLILKFTAFDTHLVRWLPVIVCGASILAKRKTINGLIQRVLITILSLIVALITGYLFAMWLWDSDCGDSKLLPDYIKCQPFDFYWIPFILTSLSAPVITMFLRKKIRTKRSNLIDDKND